MQTADLFSTYFLLCCICRHALQIFFASVPFLLSRRRLITLFIRQRHLDNLFDKKLTNHVNINVTVCLFAFCGHSLYSRHIMTNCHNSTHKMLYVRKIISSLRCDEICIDYYMVQWLTAIRFWVWTSVPLCILLSRCPKQKPRTLRWMIITPSSGKSVPGWILHVVISVSARS